MPQEPDCLVQSLGSVARIDVLSDRAVAWVQEHLELARWQWVTEGEAFAVEHRYLEPIRDAMQAAGLRVE